ncbi:DUF3791 domain-containing protein [Duncaniella sp.]|uniref:DUF3791 domain-containing protein n=1 Tax=Duncaniella sp. TaxID=2518496 RepID=UPI002601D03A|nr:DUF3791 domain-containing protein [Duncaniella sp.]
MDGRRIILQMKYARIIDGLAKKLKLPIEKAMDLFYSSTTFELIEKGIADLHARSEIYLVDELILELRERKFRSNACE